MAPVKKMGSPMPFFVFFFFIFMVVPLRDKYPELFFPNVPRTTLMWACIGLGVLALAIGGKRWLNILKRHQEAKARVHAVVSNRGGWTQASANDIATAERNVSRLVRNVDADLTEIKPDFSKASLRRLDWQLHSILQEILTEEDARIRLGVVGTYLGETFCRIGGWKWSFKCDPGLNQFGYLASVIRKGQKELDPYAWAGEILLERRYMGDFTRQL